LFLFLVMGLPGLTPCISDPSFQRLGFSHLHRAGQCLADGPGRVAQFGLQEVGEGLGLELGATSLHRGSTWLWGWILKRTGLD
jgi:hypothetical protein